MEGREERMQRANGRECERVRLQDVWVECGSVRGDVYTQKYEERGMDDIDPIQIMHTTIYVEKLCLLPTFNPWSLG